MDACGAALRRLIEHVKEAGDSKTALQIRGGGTKDFYGEEPRGVLLEVRELTGITSYEPTELVVTVLAGTPLAELEAVLAERGQCLPFEPPRFAPGGSVGGMVAAGLAGPARASVGPLRDFLLGASLLNSSGEVLSFGGQVMKNVAGYDVSRVLAGSLGILGVICEVSLKVMPMLPACRTLCFDVDEAAALELLNRWGGQAFPLSASAWHDGRLWVRLAGARAALAALDAPANAREVEPQAAAGWWSDLRDQRHEFFSFSHRDLGAGDCLWRLSVPDTTQPLALPGARLLEWGGAQRWLRTRGSAREIRSAARAVGGHATLVRAADKSPGVFAPPAPPVMAIHRRLKQAFDVAGIFNPGRLYPDL